VHGFCDQATGLVFVLLSNQRLLECFNSSYKDGHFICSGDMCSVPSRPCRSSCMSSCCNVLLPCLILVYTLKCMFFAQARSWYYTILIFQPKAVRRFFLYDTKKQASYIFWIYVKSVVMPCLSQNCCSWSCSDLLPWWRIFNNYTPWSTLLLDVVLLFISCQWPFTLHLSLGICWNL